MFLYNFFFLFMRKVSKGKIIFKYHKWNLQKMIGFSIFDSLLINKR